LITFHKSMTTDKKKQNLRLALTLASVAVVFFAGFLVKVMLMGRP